MKKVAFILLLITSFLLTSCSSDDDNGSDGSNYPQTLNLTFDVVITRNSEAIINRTLNNETITDNVNSLPYSFTYAQQEVNQGTYLKLTFEDNGVYVVTPSGSSWTDYDAVLTISSGNDVLKTETFQITEGGGIVQIDYTFE